MAAGLPWELVFLFVAGGVVRILFLRGGSGERRLSSCLVRWVFLLLPVAAGGGAVRTSFCRGDEAPLRCAVPGGVGEAVAATAQRNNAPTLPRPAGFWLRCQRRVRELLFRSLGPAIHRLFQVMFLLAYVFFKGVEQAVGVVDGGRLDLAPSSFGGKDRRWRAPIQELEWLGCVPGRWAIAEGFFYFDSFQSHCAMGLLQLKVVFVVFFGGGGRRPGGRASWFVKDPGASL
ncbi:hypothetical protein C2845_PM07G39430 [Panicum miliaceum]|uniref:Uncharacterized protein n=1 Tax=Panicum miliaceum TaxID=4540 RepID=A0A3L6SJJ3_PANMI|nr:hypothetical protein C2845_PM07G39430 [Panicum miliaceum]